jgi:hypothetical protein
MSAAKPLLSQRRSTIWCDLLVQDLGQLRREAGERRRHIDKMRADIEAL